MIRINNNFKDGTYQSTIYQTHSITRLFNELFKNIENSNDLLIILKEKFGIDDNISNDLDEIMKLLTQLDTVSMKVLSKILSDG